MAGGGDGQVRELLERLWDVGYVGFLALETHLLVTAQPGGCSGDEGMGMAVEGLMGEVWRCGRGPPRTIVVDCGPPSVSTEDRRCGAPVLRVEWRDRATGLGRPALLWLLRDQSARGVRVSQAAIRAGHR